MREKLQTLPLTQLRELAKAQGLKGVTTLKKAEIIDRLCEIAGGKAADKDLAGMDAAGAEGGGVHNIIPSEPLAAAEEKKTDEKPSETIDKEPRILKKNTREEKREEAPRRDTNRYRDDSRKRDYQPRGDYQQRSDNQSRSDYQQRGESQSRGDYQQRGESQSRGDYQQRAENQTRGEYQSRNEEGKTDFQELDSGIEADGILEVMPDGFGFIRCENFLPGENDVYVAPSQIRRFNLKTGDIVRGSRRVKTATEKFAALLYINTVNGYPTNVVERRPNFENLTPIFPNSRLHLEMPGTRNTTAMRVMDLLSPIGKGQRGMIVSPPKAGKTTLLKQVARAVTANHPEMHLIILLIDERPEEVTDIREAITGPNVEVIYSTFDVLHGSLMDVLQDTHGQILEAFSISAGLDYPGIGPEHSHYHDIKRATYVPVTDEEALEGFQLLSRVEGIIPALESSHAIAFAVKLAKELGPDKSMIVCLSGRGDKDVVQVKDRLEADAAKKGEAHV